MCLLATCPPSQKKCLFSSSPHFFTLVVFTVEQGTGFALILMYRLVGCMMSHLNITAIGLGVLLLLQPHFADMDTCVRKLPCQVIQPVVAEGPRPNFSHILSDSFFYTHFQKLQTLKGTITVLSKLPFINATHCEDPLSSTHQVCALTSCCAPFYYFNVEPCGQNSSARKGEILLLSDPFPFCFWLRL